MKIVVDEIYGLRYVELEASIYEFRKFFDALILLKAKDDLGIKR